MSPDLSFRICLVCGATRAKDRLPRDGERRQHFWHWQGSDGVIILEVRKNEEAWREKFLLQGFTSVLCVQRRPSSVCHSHLHDVWYIKSRPPPSSSDRSLMRWTRVSSRWIGWDSPGHWSNTRRQAEIHGRVCMRDGRCDITLRRGHLRLLVCGFFDDLADGKPTASRRRADGALLYAPPDVVLTLLGICP